MGNGHSRCLWHYAWSDTLLPVLESSRRMHIRIWSCRNITMRVSMLKSLRETEENYQRLFNTMIDGVALVKLIRNDEGTVVDYRCIDRCKQTFRLRR